MFDAGVPKMSMGAPDEKKELSVMNLRQSWNSAVIELQVIKGSIP